jgi:hypothetical protein
LCEGGGGGFRRISPAEKADNEECPLSNRYTDSSKTTIKEKGIKKAHERANGSWALD